MIDSGLAQRLGTTPVGFITLHISDIVAYFRAVLGGMNTVVLYAAYEKLYLGSSIHPKQDSLQKSSLDAKLPFTDPQLDKIFGDSSPVYELFRKAMGVH